MSTITASLNQLLNANYPYVRPTQPAPKANNFAQTLLGDLKPGDTVTASTQYTVATNGRLQKSSTELAIGADLAAAAELPVAAYAPPARPSSFADLSKPKAKLSPTDEAQIFDTDTIEGGNHQSAKRYYDNQGATDENGDTVAVEILSPELADQEVISLDAQRQQSVSQLYARNNDIVYNSEPLLALAA